MATDENPIDETIISKPHPQIWGCQNLNHMIFSQTEINKQIVQVKKFKRQYDCARRNSMEREVAGRAYDEARDLLREMRIQNGETEFN